jgi:Type VI secretion system/phage-baseplate injector OB domain
VPDQYFGKYTGIVKDNSDPDKLGRIQVVVPSIFPATELMQARAALSYGHYFVPENESKVWIEFEGGDSGLPLWTGLQYVSGEWATEAAVDPPTIRAIKTPSGHVLLFDDTSGQEAIQLTDGVNGHVIKLDQNGVTVTDGVSSHELGFASGGVTVKEGGGGNSVELTSSSITVKTSSGAKVELSATGVSVDAGPGMVEVKGSLIKLSSSAALPVLRITDQGIGNLGAPVVMVGPGNPQVLA